MKTFALALALLLLPVSAFGQVKTLYVDGASLGGACSDAAGNTRATNSITTPWCTIEVADGLVLAGDTVLVRAGTYTVAVFSLDKDGTAGNWIYWKSYQRRSTYLVGMVKLNGDYLQFEGFDVTNNTTPGSNTGRGIWAQASHAKIIDNYVHGIKHEAISSGSTTNAITDIEITENHVYQCQYGIRTNGTEQLVQNNVVERPYFYYLDTEVSDSDYSRFNGSNQVWRNNYFFGAVDSEIHPIEHETCAGVDNPYPCCTGAHPTTNGCSAHVDCFQTYDTAVGKENVLFEGNTCKNFDQGLESAQEVDEDYWIIRNNVFRQNLAAGSGYGMILHGIQNIYIYNNTFYDITYRGVYAVTTSTVVPDYILIKNNIFHTLDRAYSYEAAAANSLGAYNDRYNCTETPLPVGAGATDITSDPLMVSPATGDFNLVPASPANNGGSWLTTITTATGSGTSFTVADAGYFWDGQGVTTGDVIRFQTSLERRTITDITGNVITVSQSVSWTTGDGIAYNFTGTLPDMGAKEYGVEPGTCALSTSGTGQMNFGSGGTGRIELSQEP